MDMQLTGKRAIVTGASRGIGLAVADRLAAEGASVAVVARGAEALADAAERVRRHGTMVLARPTDTTDDAAVRDMVAEVVDALGGVDVLVNAAARPASSAPVPSLAELTDEALPVAMENLADELGPAGITVTVVHPGTMVTERTPAMRAARDGTAPEEVARRLAASRTALEAEPAPAGACAGAGRAPDRRYRGCPPA